MVAAAGCSAPRLGLDVDLPITVLRSPHRVTEGAFGDTTSRTPIHGVVPLVRDLRLVPLMQSGALVYEDEALSNSPPGNGEGFGMRRNLDGSLSFGPLPEVRSFDDGIDWQGQVFEAPGAIDASEREWVLAQDQEPGIHWRLGEQDIPTDRSVVFVLSTTAADAQGLIYAPERLSSRTFVFTVVQGSDTREVSVQFTDEVLAAPDQWEGRWEVLGGGDGLVTDPLGDTYRYVLTGPVSGELLLDPGSPNQLDLELVFWGNALATFGTREESNVQVSGYVEETFPL